MIEELDTLTPSLFDGATKEVKASDLNPGDFLPNWLFGGGRTIVSVEKDGGTYCVLNFTLPSSGEYTQVVRCEDTFTVEVKA